MPVELDCGYCDGQGASGGEMHLAGQDFSESQLLSQAAPGIAQQCATPVFSWENCD